MISKACPGAYVVLDYRKVYPGTWPAVGISVSQWVTICWSNFLGLECQGKEVKGDIKVTTVIDLFDTFG